MTDLARAGFLPFRGQLLESDVQMVLVHSVCEGSGVEDVVEGRADLAGTHLFRLLTQQQRELPRMWGSGARRSLHLPRRCRPRARSSGWRDWWCPTRRGCVRS
jgi:hypothetical protein